MDKKLNNLLNFSDFIKNWNPEQQKKTKRTEIGLDIVKEDIYNGRSNVENGKYYREMEPDFYVVKLEETENWRDDIQEKAGKIWGVYLLDKSEITHLASIQGSYYLYWLYNIVENYEDFDDDELFEIEMNSGGDNLNIYIDEHTKFDEEKKVEWEQGDLIEGMESEENYNELVEKIREHLNGNHPF
jgi:hypothetical protein